MSQFCTLHTQKPTGSLRILNGIHCTEESVIIPKLKKNKVMDVARHHHDFVGNVQC